MNENTKRIPIIRVESDRRYVSVDEEEWSCRLREKTSEEYEKMLYIELPTLINKIVNTRIVPVPAIPELAEIALQEIERITLAECKSISNKYRELLNSPNADTSGEK